MNNTKQATDTRSALAKRITDRHYNSIGSIPPLPLWQVIDEEIASLLADNTELRESLKGLIDLSEAYRAAIKMSDSAHLLANISPRLERAKLALKI